MMLMILLIIVICACVCKCVRKGGSQCEMMCLLRYDVALVKKINKFKINLCSGPSHRPNQF